MCCTVMTSVETNETCRTMCTWLCSLFSDLGSPHCLMWKIMDYKWRTERQKRFELDNENQALDAEIKALVNANEKLVLTMFRWHSTVLHLVESYVFKCTSNASPSRWIRPNSAREWCTVYHKTDQYQKIGRRIQISHRSICSNWHYPRKVCSL